MFIKITGKEEALKEIEKAMGLIREAEKILYSIPCSIGLEVKNEQEQAAEPEGKEPERKKRKLDAGKIRALQKAGWSVKAIAEEMDCSTAAVYKILGTGGAGKEEGK